MADSDYQFVRELVQRNRYLAMATTDGDVPWIAPLEFVSDDDLNLYFFSPEDAAHSRHIEGERRVAVTIYDAVQPDYEPSQVMRIAGVQISATTEKLAEPYPKLVADQIEAWGLPMPPYAAYRITPKQWFIPVLKDGINDRIEVQWAS